MKQLNNKIIFLTGGSSGIGYECAKAYAKEGARVVIVANDPASVKKIVEELVPNTLGYAVT
jgi:NAD(P)-dependent dehydrogenase (short-subunit alcohol dehydrogenase family)